MKLEELNLNEGNAEYQKWVSAVKKVSPKYQIIGSMKKAKAICWDMKDSPTIGIWNGTAGEVFPLKESKISGYQPPSKHPSGYADRTELRGGTNPVQFDGKEWLLTGKTGKNFSSGKRSFEYSNKDDGDARIWVTVDGEVTKD